MHTRRRVSMGELAEHLGVSKQAISRAVKAGRIPPPDKLEGERYPKFFLDDAADAFDETRIPTNNNHFGDPDSEHPPGGDDGFNDENGVPWAQRYIKERALLAEEQRRKLSSERKEYDGELHHAADIRAIMSAQNIAVRTRMLALPSRAVPVLTAELSLTPEQVAIVNRVLTDEAEGACRDLAEYDYAAIKGERQKRVGK